MEIQIFFLLQFIAHLFLDYFFQTDIPAKKKNALGFKSRFLYWHILICFILSWLFSMQLSFIWGALVISITHLLIDGFKHHINTNKFFGRYAFFIDQALHLVVLAVVVLLFDTWKGIDPTIFSWINIKVLLGITGYLVCLKPANIFIKEVFSATNIQVSSDNEMPNAGKVIGVLERILTLTLIIALQFQAVGFLIAAKSILRYRNEETLKTEYVLIGTMLSFGIAVIAGIVINYFEFVR